MTAPSIGSLIAPRSVAVVGANDRIHAFTGGPVHNLLRHGYPGRLYTVNPRRDTVQGVPCFPSVSALPEPVDSVIVVVRAEMVVPVLREAVDHGASSAIVVTSGLGEGAAGAQGYERRDELLAFLDETRLPILGPSTTGLVNLADAYVPRAVLNQLAPEHVKPGPLAVITQSGASNNTVYNRAQAAGVGVGLGVATGVQLNLSTWDVLDHALDDDRIEVAVMVVEEVGPLERVRPVLAKAREAGKPVVLLKAGRTGSGGAAVATHSGALAGDWAVQRAALTELGAVLVDDLDQLWEVASLVLRWGRPTRRPVRLGVAAFSGGEGAVVADLADDAGLELPPVTDAFADLVDERLSLAGAANPFDPTGEVLSRPEDGMAVLDGFGTLNDYDVTLFALNTQAGGTSDGMVARVLDSIVHPGSRLAVSYWPVPNLSDGLDRALLDRGLPVFTGSHRAVSAIARWAEAAPLPSGAPLPEGTRLRAVPGLTYGEARTALAGIGVPFAAARTVATREEAVAAAGEIGFPVVVKGDVTSTTHKAAAGLVRLDLRTPDDVAAAFDAVAAPRAVVEQQVRGTVELFAGVSMDRELGPVLVFGAGGSMAEHLADTAVCPVDLLDTAALDRLVLATATGRFLADRRPDTLDQVRDLLTVLAGARAEIDLNPVAVTGDGLVALDARVNA